MFEQRWNKGCAYDVCVWCVCVFEREPSKIKELLCTCLSVSNICCVFILRKKRTFPCFLSSKSELCIFNCASVSHCRWSATLAPQPRVHVSDIPISLPHVYNVPIFILATFRLRKFLLNGIHLIFVCNAIASGPFYTDTEFLPHRTFTYFSSFFSFSSTSSVFGVCIFMYTDHIWMAERRK